jgi:hypothetical protein
MRPCRWFSSWTGRRKSVTVLWIRNDLVRIWILLSCRCGSGSRILPLKTGQQNSWQILSVLSGTWDLTVQDPCTRTEETCLEMSVKWNLVTPTVNIRFPSNHSVNDSYKKSDVGARNLAVQFGTGYILEVHSSLFSSSWYPVTWSVSKQEMPTDIHPEPAFLWAVGQHPNIRERNCCELW